MASYRFFGSNVNTTWLINKFKETPDKYCTLDKDQERQMIERYRDDPEKLREELFNHNVRLVFSTAAKYVSPRYDLDTLVQDGMYGLAEAISTFDIDRGTKFSTHCMWTIRKRILANFYGDEHTIETNSTSLSAHVASSKTQGDTTGTFENVVHQYLDPSQSPTGILATADQISANERTELCDMLMERLEQDSSLSSDQKNIFIDLIYNHERITDVAYRYNITRHEVNEITKTITNKFRTILEQEYHITNRADLA